MSSKRSKTDLLVRQRFVNPLPAPAFPPKLLTIKTDPSRYTSYDFLVPLSMERVVPMIVDGEGGMHLNALGVPGYWEAVAGQGRSSNSAMVPDLDKHAPELDDDDLELLAEPAPPPAPGTSAAAAAAAAAGINQGLMPSTSGASLDLVGSGLGNGGLNSPASMLEKRRKDVAFVNRTTVLKSSATSDAAAAARQEALAAQ